MTAAPAEERGASPPAAERWQLICEELRAEFPSFQVVPKERSRLMRGLHRALGMRLWNPEFLTHYTTVLVTRVYMPQHLIGTDAGYGILRHERVHMRDAVRTGVLPFALSYVFLLPAGLTMRAYWEWRAYAETLRVELEDTGTISDATLEHVARRFTGPDYLFMWPFPGLVRRRLRALRARLLSEAAAGPSPPGASSR